MPYVYLQNAIAGAIGFVAPNTGDRLWGATVCAWAVTVLFSSRDNIFHLLIQSSHASISIFMFRIPASGSTRLFSHCLMAPEVTVWSAHSSRVGFNRMSVDDSVDIPSCIVFYWWCRGRCFRQEVNSIVSDYVIYKSIYIWRHMIPLHCT